MDSTVTPQALRRAICSGTYTDNTSGMAAGFVQCNVVILPAENAMDFLRFCQINPKPCPLIALGDPDVTALPGLGDIDICTDLPRYRVFRQGNVTEEVTDIAALWRGDLVTFALGCLFSFEDALLADGLEVRNVSQRLNVLMYQTDIHCADSGDLFRVKWWSACVRSTPAMPFALFKFAPGFPQCTLVHLGDPRLIGIEDLERPDYGDAVQIYEAEIPLFWACGVTPQVALAAARLPFAITHSPGCMLITDMHNSQLAVL
ncbi:MAG: DUF1445 domain-containing protein [Halioglobus sp.]|nr:DUF1445 domain-containing protein [Halioglobus sp.]